MNNSKSLIVPIIFPSAKDFWLSNLPERLGYSLTNRKLVSLPESFDLHIHTAEAKEIASILGLPLPLTLCGKKDNDKRHIKNLIIKRQAQPFPPHSFISFRKDNYIFYIASPELCFLQSQRYLGPIESIRFGSNLCSIFRPCSEEEYGQKSMTPRTDQTHLSDFLNLLSSYPGIKAAKRSVLYVLNNSNSPIETALGILFALPIDLGGYGIGKPSMNYSIDLTGAANKLLNYDKLRVDFAWPKQKFAIEYNSTLTHANAAQMSIDSNRMTAMAHSGFTPLSITAQNIKDFQSLERIMRVIRSNMKLPSNELLLSKYQAKRMQVANALLQWT